MGRRGGGCRGPRARGHHAPRTRPGPDPRLTGGDQGSDHHAGRLGVPQRERRAPADARPVRGGAGPRVRSRGCPRAIPTSNLVVVRENTEDLYQGSSSRTGTPRRSSSARSCAGSRDGSCARTPGSPVKPISVTGARRIVRFALEYVRAHGRRKVTLGHKANIMRFSDGLFLSIGQIEAEGASGGVVRGDGDRPALDAAGARALGVRRPAAAEPVRRHHLGPVRRAGRRARPGGRREPRVGVRGVRARPRQRTRHRRQGRREPDRDDPVGRDAAAPRAGTGSGRSRRARGRPGARTRRRAHPDLGGTSSTDEVAAAIDRELSA